MHLWPRQQLDERHTVPGLGLAEHDRSVLIGGGGQAAGPSSVVLSGVESRNCLRVHEVQGDQVGVSVGAGLGQLATNAFVLAGPASHGELRH